MNIRNCRRCGNIFNVSVTDKNICPECSQKEEEDFEIARAFVKEHPGCSMQMVIEETNIDKKLIMKFVREQRIEFADGSKPLIGCEKCGSPIQAGRFCNNCLSKLGKAMMNSPNSVKEVESTLESQNKGMHYSKRK